MTIRNEAMISRYFDRMMSPGEEQNFLISLAASNELRLAFRSQLELMKAIRDDKHDMRPIAEVRSRTLMALGLTGAVTAPFLEQALLHEDAQAATEIAAPARVSFFSRMTGKLVIAGSGLAAGFLAAAMFFSQPPSVSQVPVTQKNPTQISAPAVQAPTVTSQVSEPVRETHTLAKRHNRADGTDRTNSIKSVTSTPVVTSSGVRPSGGAMIQTENEHRDSSAR